jgi:hypothetical protein
MEIMLHRNPTQDDGRGMAQGVNDNSRAIIPLMMMMSSPEEASKHWKHMSLLHHQPLKLYFTTADKAVKIEDWYVPMSMTSGVNHVMICCLSFTSLIPCILH